MATLKINGVNIYYEQTGQAGEPLVLVHGSWVDHRTWLRVVPGLARSFRVITYDRRGHSQSERPQAPGQVSEDVSDLAGLVEALQLGPAHIAGHSLGGVIALRLAAERPDLFRSLMVHEPPLFALLADEPDGPQLIASLQHSLLAAAERIEAGDSEGGVRYFVEEIVFGPGAWEHVPPEVKEIVIYNAPTFLDEVRDPQAFAVNLPGLAGFDRPALLTYGEASPPVFQRVIHKLAPHIPNGVVRSYPGAGHEPEHDQPENFIAQVKEFTAPVVSRAANRPG
jgi:pimeloyl-ACP methyl ester carboxylesterase